MVRFASGSAWPGVCGCGVCPCPGGTIGTASFELFEPRLRAVVDAEALPRAAEHVIIRPSGLTDRGNQTAIAIARRELDASRAARGSG